MKRVVLPLFCALLSLTHAATVDEESAEQLVAGADGLRVMALRGAPDETSDGVLTVWVESGKTRADLPPSPVAIKGDAEGNSWSLLIPPSMEISPDEQWLFATQKVCTGYRIGYLYKRGKGLHFSIATKERFDALAWRFFGKTEGVDIEALIASDSPAHLIDFAGFSDRYVGISLRGAIENVPAAKKVASNPKNQRGATGVFDWQCLYDLKEGKFVIPETMKAYNLGAWRRWADFGANSWNAAIENELNSAFRAVVTKLAPEAQVKLRKEQREWLAERDRNFNNPNFDFIGFTRQRAVELQMQTVAGD
jgi:hypothetical protein